MLVLQGIQGARKSSSFIALSGRPEWCLESMPSLRDSDSMSILRGKSICVFNELDSIHGSGISRVKDFLTCRVDSFRPKYGRYVIDVPRSCVFGGTANDHQCLPPDSSGHRRYWPVRVFRADIEKILTDRDQMWAEAVSFHKAGEAWYPVDPSLSELLTAETEQFVEEDPWVPVVRNWIAGWVGGPFEAWQCLFYALGMPKDRIGRREGIRIGNILHQLGYIPRQERVGTESRRARVYYPMVLEARSQLA
jgi:putative DNA primase/helicase